MWGERQTRMLTTPFILPKPSVPLQDRLAGFQKKFLKGKVQLPSVSRESHPKKKLSRKI